MMASIETGVNTKQIDSSPILYSIWIRTPHNLHT